MKSIVVVGATGMVGERIVKLLEERNFPVKSLRLFSSPEREGREIVFKDNPIEIETLSNDAFKGCDIAFFAVGAQLAKELVPKARMECLVIDKSPAFRMEPDVPLVIPEVNPERIEEHKNLISSPNCTTIPLAATLAPLKRVAKIERVVVSSYQSVSGAGRGAVEEFKYQLEKLAMGEAITKEDTLVLPYPIGANIIPKIDEFTKGHYTAEEEKLIDETRKILELPDLAITATCVRVPVFIGHSMAVNIEFERHIEVKEVKSVLSKAAGVRVVEEPKYPMPVEVVDKDEIFVGRIREDNSFLSGLNLWIVTDNLRKGAALNAVQIAERI